MTLVALLILGGLADAQPLEGWHIQDFGARIGPVQAALHTQFRLAPRFRQFAHGRVGPVVAIPRGNLVFGLAYYYQDTRSQGQDQEDSHRAFGWVEFPLWGGRNQFSNRVMYERFMGQPARPDFNRYRYMVRYQRVADWGPQASAETFVDRHGLFGMRYTVGIRKALSNAARIDFGYFYDQRVQRVGGTRHILFTTLRFQLRE